MAKGKKKWEEIADILKDRILNQELKPGQEFPTTKELVQEFNVHIGTIQHAVDSLIQEGLILTHGSGSTKRLVRHLIDRSIRKEGFLTENAGRSQQKILNLQIINDKVELPQPILESMNTPVLFYHTLQLRDGVPVAISRSYISSLFPLEMLQDILKNPKNELYTVMETLGVKPFKCQESLVIDRATEDDCKIFSLSSSNNITVVNIKRKVFSKDDVLLEFCMLTDRADAYEFVYDFSF